MAKKKVSNEEIISSINKDVEKSKGDSTVWADKQAKYNRLRMRIKKAKTFPFVGCSNIRMPTAETKIRKLKAALMNVVFGIRPVVQVIPPPSGNYETAQKIEKWLDHLIMDVMDIYPKSIIAVDQECEQGFYLMKPYWRMETTKRQEEFNFEDVSMEDAMALFDGSTTEDDVRSFVISKFSVDTSEWVIEENEKAIESVVERILKGDDKFTFYVQDVIYNAPDIALISPEHCFVPSESGFDPQRCTFLVHEFLMPFHEVKQNAESKSWDISEIDEIGKFVGVDYQTVRERNKATQEGVERLNSPGGLIKIWEYYGWYDINNDGIKEKCVITLAPDFNRILRKIGLPLISGKFPFVKFFYELTDDRWYAHRGIPELIEDIIKEIDTQHNMKLDQQTIRNAPMFVYRAGMVNPNLVQMIPNQGIPVNGVQPLNDVIQVLNAHNPNVEFSYEREQMLLESKVEEMIGQVDFTLQSMINRRQPRTFGEVELQNQNMQQVFSLDANMHSHQFSELFNFIYDLWSQYGDDETEFAYFGPEGWEKIKLTKEEIQGKYRITVRGNDSNTNPMVKMQKAQQVIMAITNPVFLQTGVVTPLEIANGLKRFYQTLDIPNWQELVAPPQPPPPPPPPPPVAAFIKPKFESLTDGEQAQVLMSAGVQPDMVGRAMRKDEELMNQGHDRMQEGPDLGPMPGG